MNSAVAVLTYRRAHALKTFLAGYLATKLPYRLAIFEDAGGSDDTVDFLTNGATFKGIDAELEVDVWEHPNFTAYVGRRNQGVAGNSNRAIRWFMRGQETHLCLCNDDLVIKGDFVKTYYDAHRIHKIGLWCYCPFDDELYRGVEIKSKGRTIKLLPRKTGIMMSMTRELVEKIGYYDVYIGRFGNDHCEFNVRATLCGFLTINGQPQHCLDVPCPELAAQDVASSISPVERQAFDRDAEEAFAIAAARHAYTGHYRPFKLYHGRYAGGFNGTGIPAQDLERLGYPVIVDYDYADEACRA